MEASASVPGLCLLKIHMEICSKMIANLMECVYTKGSKGGCSYA